MAKCAYCESSILLGGKRDGELRFCSDQCLEKGALLALSSQIPIAAVSKLVHDVHSGNCSKCNRKGPIDVHTSYWVWSALLVTVWSSRLQICCRFCGAKWKVVDALGSLLLGWWGAWGLFVTPIQFGRNILGLFDMRDPYVPSSQLETVLRLGLADKLFQARETGKLDPSILLAGSTGDALSDADEGDSHRPDTHDPSQSTRVISVKIECGCGQRYAFDVEPLNGRTPGAVNCPKCGMDGTDAANQVIAESMKGK